MAKQLFDEFDSEGVGWLSCEDMVDVLRYTRIAFSESGTCDLTDDELFAVAQSLDTSGSGQIKYEVFFDNFFKGLVGSVASGGAEEVEDVEYDGDGDEKDADESADERDTDSAIMESGEENTDQNAHSRTAENERHDDRHKSISLSSVNDEDVSLSGSDPEMDDLNEDTGDELVGDGVLPAPMSTHVGSTSPRVDVHSEEVERESCHFNSEVSQPSKYVIDGNQESKELESEPNKNGALSPYSATSSALKSPDSSMRVSSAVHQSEYERHNISSDDDEEQRENRFDQLPSDERIAALKDDIRKLAGHKRTSMTKYSRVENIAKELENENIELRDKVKDLDTHLEHSRNEVETLRQSVEAERVVASKLRDRVPLLEEELDEAKSELTRLREMLEKERLAKHESQLEVDKLNATVSKLHVDVKESRETSEQVMELKETVRQMDAVEDLNEHLRDQISALENEVTERDRLISSLTNTIQNLEEHIENTRMRRLGKRHARVRNFTPETAAVAVQATIRGFLVRREQFKVLGGQIAQLLHQLLGVWEEMCVPLFYRSSFWLMYHTPSFLHLTVVKYELDRLDKLKEEGYNIESARVEMEVEKGHMYRQLKKSIRDSAKEEMYLTMGVSSKGKKRKKKLLRSLWLRVEFPELPGVDLGNGLEIDGCEEKDDEMNKPRRSSVPQTNGHAHSHAAEADGPFPSVTRSARVVMRIMKPNHDDVRPPSKRDLINLHSHSSQKELTNYMMRSHSQVRVRQHLHSAVVSSLASLAITIDTRLNLEEKLHEVSIENIKLKEEIERLRSAAHASSETELREEAVNRNPEV